MIFLAELGSLLGLMIGMVVFFLLIAIGLYVYSALALMAIAKRTNTKRAWLAWIPYANIYLVSKIAKKHWWPILLLILITIFSFFPENMILNIIELISTVIFAVFMIIWWWKICQRRGKPGWWALIVIIPLVGGIWALILLGILAWGKGGSVAEQKNFS
ncbi:MAG: hypothetical protein ABFQ65_04540 [Nanoarchaeota archaeon]